MSTSGGDIRLSKTRRAELEVSVEAAAVLLSLAMRETEQPVSTVCEALSRISARLHGEGSQHGSPHPHGTAAEHEVLRQQLAEDLAACLQGLQFHDRLIQQLAAVRNFLATLAVDHSVDAAGFGAQRWEELLRMVRTRLTADSHHQLFELLMRTGVIESDPQASPMAAEGSVELF